jgi:predicted dehydrogenase/threonine dehydrogenase-like Zn-dependent dehydrogenase
MKQVVQSYKTGELRVLEVPVPQCPGAGVLVRTRVSVISVGTEKMIVDLAKKSLMGKAKERPDLVRKVLDKVKREGLWATLDTVRAKLDSPVPLGYSCAGVVEEAGQGAPGFRPGDRVACAGAGFANHAELNAVPVNLATRVPEGVSDEDAAFATVASIALQGLRIAEPTLGERVVVIGLGLLGQLAVSMFKANGCRVLAVDLDPTKVTLALKRGADAGSVRNTDDTVGDALRFTDGRGADVAYVAAAAKTNDPLVLAGEISRDRGRVVVVGALPMEFPRKDYYEKELALLFSRSYGPGRYNAAYEGQGLDFPAGYVRWTEGRNLEAVLDLMARGLLPVADLVSHRFPIQDAERAYALLDSPEGRGVMGITLSYATEPDRKAVPLKEATAGRAEGRLGLGALGAGAFATTVLLPKFVAHGGVRPVAVADARGVAARHAAAKFGFEKAVASVQELLADPAVEAVAIATRHDSHAALAVKALDAGKHVFVEKPLALDEAGVEAVLAAARAAGRQILVGYNRRFSPLARDLEAFVRDAGPLQILYRVNAGVIPTDSWIQDPAVGGGRIVGEACHFVDLMSFLCGSLPVAVTCSGLGPGLAEASFDGRDNVSATIEFTDGSLGTLVYTAMGDPGQSKERLEVYAGGKMAVLDDFRALTTSAGGRRRARKLARPDKGYDAEVAAFVEAVRSGSPAIGHASLSAVSRATFAMVRSAGNGDRERLDT